MTDTDQKKEDEVLKRMLKTPPKPQKPLKGIGNKGPEKLARADGNSSSSGRGDNRKG